MYFNSFTYHLHVLIPHAKDNERISLPELVNKTLTVGIYELFFLMHKDKSLDIAPMCDHLNESHWATLFMSVIVQYAAQGGSYLQAWLKS